jgi:hypothetical protein
MLPCVCTVLPALWTQGTSTPVCVGLGVFVAEGEGEAVMVGVADGLGV